MGRTWPWRAGIATVWLPRIAVIISDLMVWKGLKRGMEVVMAESDRRAAGKAGRGFIS